MQTEFKPATTEAKPLFDDTSPQRITVLCAAVLGVGILASILIGIWNTISISNVIRGQREELTFAQLADGSSIYLEQLEPTERRPETIERFVTQYVQMTFSWSNQVPFTEEPDTGIQVQGGRVPTGAYYASHMLEPDFGKASLVSLAELVPQDLFRGTSAIRQFVELEWMSEPRKIGDTGWQVSWEVDLVSTRVIYDPNTGRDERIPFNKTITVVPVPIQTPTYGEETHEIEKLVYQLRSAGLQITEIRNFYPNEVTPLEDPVDE